LRENGSEKRIDAAEAQDRRVKMGPNEYVDDVHMAL
jgi:hypothetical protein